MSPFHPVKERRDAVLRVASFSNVFYPSDSGASFTNGVAACAGPGRRRHSPPSAGTERGPERRRPEHHPPDRPPAASADSAGLAKCQPAATAVSDA